MSVSRRMIKEIQELYTLSREDEHSNDVIEKTEEDMNESLNVRTCPNCKMTEYVNESKVCLECGHPTDG